MEDLKKFFESRKFITAAHRGASGEAPENTLAAFRLALEQGADMIEIDVRFLKDGTVVAAHDLEKIAGEKKKSVSEYETLEEIKTLDAGSWFDPKFAGERIPSLEEIVDLIDGKAALNLEIKSSSEDNVSEENLARLLSFAKNRGLLKSVLFASFDTELLKIAKKIEPKAYVAAIKLPGVGSSPRILKEETNCDAFICSAFELNERIAEEAREISLPVGIYDAESPEKIKFALKLGVKAFGTNYPAKTRKLIESLL